MRPIRLAVPLVAGILLVAGCGETDSTDQSSQAAQSAEGRPAGGMFAGENLTKLADALGVSESKLQSALESIMPQGGPGDGGPPPGAGDGQPPTGTPPAGSPPAGGNGGGRLAEQLAEKLGLSEEKVSEALQSVMPQQPPSASPSSES